MRPCHGTKEPSLTTQADTEQVASDAAAVSADRSSGPPRLESFSYDDAIVRMFMLAPLVWALVAMLVGVIIALQRAFHRQRRPSRSSR